MTLNDFLKRIDIEKCKDKMIIFSDGKGWSNVWFKENENEIIIYNERNEIFTSEKE